MIQATFALINKSDEHFSLKVLQIPVPHERLWNYYHKSDKALISQMRSIMGIPKDAAVFCGVYADYLINPKTGKILFGKDSDIDDFLCSMAVKRMEFLNGENPYYKPRFLKGKSKKIQVIS